MKICFITSTVFSLGGVQRVVSVLANNLSENFDVTIICTNDKFKINRELYNLSEKVKININKELINKKLINKIITKPVKQINLLTGILNNKFMESILRFAYYPKEIQNRFINHLNSQKYDIVIGVEGYYSLLLGIISNKLVSKTIGWQHNSYNAYLNSKFKYYWNQDQLFNKYVPKLNKYVVLTEEDRISYKKINKIICTVIYNPVSFKSIEKAQCIEKSIIFVGRFAEQQKGLDLLIKAFHLIHKQRKDWILKMVGDGDDKIKLIKDIKKYNLENNVILVGESNYVKEHYLKSSIFVSTSRWEGFGLVIIEAMECGLPVVSFDNSGPKEIINSPGINGILVKNHDFRKLSSEIISLIDNYEKRKTISLESIKRAKFFSSDKISKEWIKLLKDI